jgi:hypothetical protein
MFRSLGANIWDYEIPIRFGGIPLWHRMTVIGQHEGAQTSLIVAYLARFQTT